MIHAFILAVRKARANIKKWFAERISWRPTEPEPAKSMDKLTVRRPSRDAVAVHPEWVGSAGSFDENYEQLFCLTYGLRDPAPEPFAFGPARDRKCAFCGRGEPDARFVSESHLIPAALGNRHFFSNEECDACNGAGGQDQDKELALMLFPQRVVGGVRARKGTAEYETSDKRASVGGGVFNGPLVVSQHQGEEGVLSVEGNTGLLTVKAPAHRPEAALRSILRSVWLRMEPPQRAAHPSLLEILKGTLVVEPCEYVEIFISGGVLEKVTLQCWAKRASSKVVGADVVVRLLFVHTAICWAMPEVQGGKARHLPFMVPPLVGLGDDQEPKARLVRIQQAGHVVPESESTLTFGFASMSKGDVGAPQLRSTSDAPTDAGISAKLQYRTGSSLLEIGVAKIARTKRPGKDLVVELRGGELAGIIRMTPERGKFTTLLLPGKTSAANALRTADAFHAMGTQAGTLIVTPLDGGVDGLEVDLPGGQQTPVHPLRPLLEALAAVEQAFGREFRFPEKDGNLPVDSIMMLGTGILKGRFRRHDERSFGLSIEESAFKTLYDSLGTGDFKLGFSFSFAFLGFETTEEVNVILRVPKLVYTTTEATSGGPMVRAEFEAESVTYEFPRFLKTGA